MSVVAPVDVFTDVSVTGLADWAWMPLQLWPSEGAVVLVAPEVVVLVVLALNDEGSLLVRMLRTGPVQLAASPKYLLAIGVPFVVELEPRLSSRI
jgi:hypothetical protein